MYSNPQYYNDIKHPIVTVPDRHGELYLELLKKCLTASIYEESSWKVIEPKPLRKELKTNFAIWAKAKMRARIITWLRKRSILLVRRNEFSPTAREQGADWPCFGFTMIGHRRLDNIQNCIKTVIHENIAGDVIETGAWRGGSTIFMKAALGVYSGSDRVVWVADSFKGMPIPTDRQDGWDFSEVEQLNVSLEQVKANFAKFGLLDDKVRFLPGWFKDTLPTAPIKQLAILRLDGDLYNSTMDALANLYHLVSPGGYVIVDDYYGWEGCRRAVQEFRDKRNIQAKIENIDKEAVYWRVNR